MTMQGCVIVPQMHLRGKDIARVQDYDHNNGPVRYGHKVELSKGQVEVA